MSDIFPTGQRARIRQVGIVIPDAAGEPFLSSWIFDRDDFGHGFAGTGWEVAELAVVSMAAQRGDILCCWGCGAVQPVEVLPNVRRRIIDETRKQTAELLEQAATSDDVRGFLAEHLPASRPVDNEPVSE